ncbi:MAG: CHAT domain-containing protein [Flavobacteriales bacterium]|nr:hypothetical protein [Flavobacteriales bacterium]MCC6577693.1 CHAT domain-containing protein [Flavobacteriales bacterium]NUQ15070.1 CHAT domain-containing protein [Flavobacteriales bacterium]
MKRWLILLAGALPIVAPAQQSTTVAARHARIEALDKAGDHAGVIREVETQLREASGTVHADSLHRYLYKYARAQRKLHGPAAAITAGERVLRLVRERGVAAHEMEALFDLSWVYYELGEARQCARVDSMAVVVADRDPAIPFVQKGRARQYLAFDHSILGEHAASAHWAQEALRQYGLADSVPAVQWAESYTAVGVAFWHLGRIREAEAQYAKALARLNGRTDEASISRKASTYGNLGVLWQNAGDLPKAQAYYEDALRQCELLLRSAKDDLTREEAIISRSRTYLNLATVYHGLGDLGRARELLDLCWRDRSGVLAPDDPQLLAVKERFADLEMNAGNLSKAYDLLHSYVAAAERRFGPGSEEYVRAVAKLGGIRSRQGMHLQADSLFARSLAAGRAHRDPAIDPVLAGTLRERASLRTGLGRTGEALADLGQARSILTSIYDSTHHLVAQVDVQRAEAAFKAGDHRAALEHAERALRALDARVRAIGSDPLPHTGPAPELLPDAIYWKLRASRALAAPGSGPADAWNADLDLAITALARSRGAVYDAASQLLLVAAQKRLFDLARNIAFEAYERSPGPATIGRFLHLAEADRSVLLKARLNAFAGLRFAGIPDSLVAREQELLQALTVDAGDRTTAADLARREAAMRDHMRMLAERHPRYFALRYGEPTVTLDQLRAKLVTPQRPLLAYTMHDEHLYLLVVRSDTAALMRVDGSGLDADVRAFNRSIRDREVVPYIDVAHRLYQRILAPVAGMLTGEELLIIPDGSLHQVSFEALVDAPCTPTRLRDHFLLRRFAIAYLHSATTAIRFTDLAREHADGALALAPGFSDEDKDRYVKDLGDSTRLDRHYLAFVRQPFALRTAEGLGRTLSATLLLGTAANERSLREQAARHGILHLGTHAEMNPRDPMYARLVLSKGDPEGGTDDDGYLHAYEIYALDLHAQLAVLTACETGAGTDEAGEGVRSLGYGFAYAGCPSLVMALWNIDEKVTADLVAGLYEHLADGMPRHKALRQAKLDHVMQARDELVLPYYWAGLVLVGDVTPVRFESRPVWPWLLAGLAVVAVVVLLLRRRRRRSATH